jgi:hypothetical protein
MQDLILLRTTRRNGLDGIVSAAGRVAADQTEWWAPQVWPACQAEHLGGSGAAGPPTEVLNGHKDG